MSTITKFLLPCECGAKIEIEISQAGQRVACECGKSCEAPSLRGMRELESVQVESDKRIELRESNWDLSRGAGFAAAVSIAVAALLFGGMHVVKLWSLGKVYTEEEATVLLDKSIDEFDAEAAFDQWYYFRKEGLGSRKELMDYQAVASEARQMWIVIGISSTILALGIVGAAFFALKRAPAASP